LKGGTQGAEVDSPKRSAGLRKIEGKKGKKKDWLGGVRKPRAREGKERAEWGVKTGFFCCVRGVCGKGRNTREKNRRGRPIGGSSGAGGGPEDVYRENQGKGFLLTGAARFLDGGER